MRRSIIIRLLSLTCLLCLSAVLPGCTSLLSATTADVAGVASAGITSGVTRNAAVGTGIGLAVAAGAGAGLHYVERRVHATEQNNIAEAAGPLAPGQVAPWRVVHTVPIESDKHGQVTVFQVIQAPDFNCKRIVFSIDNDKNLPKDYYTTTICHDGLRWKWALAEPSTDRWDGLQ